MTSLPPQSALYLLPAGGFGVPQIRDRVINILTRQGEVPPPTPMFTHQVGYGQQGLGTVAALSSCDLRAADDVSCTSGYELEHDCLGHTSQPNPIAPAGVWP